MRSKSRQLMNEISAYVDQYYSERHMQLSLGMNSTDIFSVTE